MLNVTNECNPPEIVFHLVGDLRLEDIARLRESFFKAMTREEISALVLDLSQLRTIDASGVSLFVSTKNSIGKFKGQLRLTNMQPDIYRYFARHNLDEYFGLRSSHESA